MHLGSGVWACAETHADCREPAIGTSLDGEMKWKCHYIGTASGFMSQVKTGLKPDEALTFITCLQSMVTEAQCKAKDLASRPLHAEVWLLKPSLPKHAP